MWVKPGRDMTSEAIKANLIFLGWDIFGFEGCRDKQAFYALVKRNSLHRRNWSKWSRRRPSTALIGKVAAQHYRFIREMAEEEAWVLVPDKEHAELRLAKVTDCVRPKSIGGERLYARPVVWQKTVPFKLIPAHLQRRLRPQQTCVEVTDIREQIRKLFQAGPHWGLAGSPDSRLIESARGRAKGLKRQEVRTGRRGRGAQAAQRMAGQNPRSARNPRQKPR